MLKVRFIGRDMRMEFFHPERGIVRTSRVREIWEHTAPEFAETTVVRKAS
jgi:hypothetical protein